MGKIITIGITGASGAVLARTALRLLDADARVSRVHLVITEAGQRLLAQELGIGAQDAKQMPALITGINTQKIEPLPNRDIGAERDRFRQPNRGWHGRHSMLGGYPGFHRQWRQRRFYIDRPAGGRHGLA